MPYKDPEKARLAANERKRRYRQRQHDERYGPGVGDMRGRHGNTPRGPRVHRWNNGITKSRQGYLKLQVGKNHPLADPNGYAFLHRLVWVAAGRHWEVGIVIHHKNRIITDNRLSNLQTMTLGEHNAKHNPERGRDSNGRFIGSRRENNDLPTMR